MFCDTNKRFKEERLLKQKKAPVVDISSGAEALELLFRRRTERQATPTFALKFCGGRKVRAPEVIRVSFVPAPFSAYFKPSEGYLYSISYLFC